MTALDRLLTLGNVWRAVMAATAAAALGCAAVTWWDQWRRSSAGMWRELDRRERTERETVQ